MPGITKKIEPFEAGCNYHMKERKVTIEKQVTIRTDKLKKGKKIIKKKIQELQEITVTGCEIIYEDERYYDYNLTSHFLKIKYESARHKVYKGQISVNDCRKWRGNVFIKLTALQKYLEEKKEFIESKRLKNLKSYKYQKNK
jgi:hypothetical protein